jgi:hypothetical protein
MILNPDDYTPSRQTILEDQMTNWDLLQQEEERELGHAQVVVRSLFEKLSFDENDLDNAVLLGGKCWMAPFDLLKREQ